MNFSFAAANKALARFLPTESPVTYGILGFSCILYVFSLLWTIRLGSGQLAGGGGVFGFDVGQISGEVLARLGASLPLAYNLHEPWRFVMAVFLHASLLHIGFNMWVLMDIGPQIEQLYGSGRFLFIYVVTGMAGYLLSSAFGNFSVGGSSGLLGLIGLLLAMTMGHKTAHMQMLRGQLVRWLIYIGIMGFLFRGTDNLAHLGGLIAGFIFGKIMADRPPSSNEERKRATALGWIAAAMVVASLAMVVKDFVQST